MKEYSIQSKPFNDWMSFSSPGLGYQSLNEAKDKAILLKQQTGLAYRIVKREINDMGLTLKSTVVIERI